MTTLTIFGASGRTGRRLVAEAIAAGHAVRALVRDPSSAPAADGVTLVAGDVLIAGDVARALEGAHGVLSALGGGSTSGPGDTRSRGMATIVEGMSRLGVPRVVAIGGGGVLDAVPGPGLRADQPGYPEVFRRVSAEHRRAWEALVGSALDWTYVCPPDIPDRDATGSYRVLADRMPDVPRPLANGDLAAFMVREWSERRFSRRRVGIAG